MQSLFRQLAINQTLQQNESYFCLNSHPNSPVHAFVPSQGCSNQAPLDHPVSAGCYLLSLTLASQHLKASVAHSSFDWQHSILRSSQSLPWRSPHGCSQPFRFAWPCCLKDRHRQSDPVPPLPLRLPLLHRLHLLGRLLAALGLCLPLKLSFFSREGTVTRLLMSLHAGHHP